MLRVIRSQVDLNAFLHMAVTLLEKAMTLNYTHTHTHTHTRAQLFGKGAEPVFQRLWVRFLSEVKSSHLNRKPFMCQRPIICPQKTHSARALELVN